jgi:Di-haem cytochrome c peroxidase
MLSGYAELFQKAFPAESDPITPYNSGAAIGAYERRLITRTQFDDYLRGSEQAVSPAAVFYVPADRRQLACRHAMYISKLLPMLTSNVTPRLRLDLAAI